MRRLLALATVMVMVPAIPAMAEDLEQLLERSHNASYTAEQIISCSTPEGVRDALVSLEQSGGEMVVGAPVEEAVEVSVGSGGWALVRDGSVVSSAAVAETGQPVPSAYVVDAGTPTTFLGRAATLYRMFQGEVARADLVFDDESGALLRAVTYTADGEVYCERRFVEFDPTPPASQDVAAIDGPASNRSELGSRLPAELAGFQLLDQYAEAGGLVFAYYSDGFFSFAVFETPVLVRLTEPSSVAFDGNEYERSFSPGQVTYAWEILSGGMALVGDLPPDMHEPVLDGLPAPQDPGMFRRLWRSLFG